MPAVPRYDDLTVAPRALPGARQESIASAALFKRGGSDIAELGKGLQNAGADLAGIAVKMAERENADTLFTVETAFKDDLIKFDTEQRAKKGAAAKGVTQDAEKWFGETAQRHSGALKNDVQRRLFSQQTEKLRLQTLDSFSKHEANEARVSLTDSTNATIVSSINRAAANPNDWTILEAEKAEIRKRVEVLGQINGHSPETREVILGEKLTTLHAQMIQALVRDTPTAAQAYYKKYENEIDGSKRAELGKFVAEATSTSVGDGVAAAVWEKFKPKNATEPLNLSDAEDAIRSQLKGNDDAIAKGLKGLKERASAYEYQRKQEGNALEASVNGIILKGASTNQVRNSPEFISLSARAPEDARKVLTFMENQDYTRVARAAASEQRADAAESRRDRRLHRDTLDTTLKLSDPDRLMSLSRDEIVNLLPKLGSQSTQALLQRYDSYEKNPAKLIEARIDKQDFDAIALGAGLHPNQSNKPEAEKDRLVRLQQRVETVIDAEQRARGNKPMLREEKQAIMQREIDNAVMVNEWGRDPKRSLATLTPDEQKGAYVTVGGKDVKLADIPAPFRQQAVAARRKQGLPTTEATIAELWLRSTGKLK